MRRTVLVALVAVIALSLVFPTLAVSAGQGRIKLKVFVHYPKAKPVKPGTCDPSTSNPGAYALTGWVTGSKEYRVNYDSIPSTVVNPQEAITRSFAVWETNGVTFNEGAPTTVKRYKYDGQNVVIWGHVPSGAIAVTYTWYDSRSGQALECDTVMGSSLPWKWTGASNPDATCGDLLAYDVQNILTHELGHWMGLADLYEAENHDLTMYGYGDKGELKKDTLAAGDINGLRALY